MIKNKFQKTSFPIWRTKASGYLLLWCLCLACPLSAQEALTERLLQALSANPQEDSIRVNLLNDLAWEYKIDQPQQATNLLKESISIASRIGYPRGEAQAYNNLGVVETIADNLPAAEAHYQKALELRLALDDLKGVASLYNKLGNLRESRADFPGALSFLQKSLKIREELKDTLRIARVNYNLGLLQESMGNYPEALDHALTHLAISEQLQDDSEIANAHNLLGNIKSELERFEDALQHHQTSLAIQKKLGDEWEIASAHNNLGNSLDDLAEQNLLDEQFTLARSQFTEALKNYQHSLTLYRQLEDPEGISQAYNNIGLVHKNLGTYFAEVDQKDSSDFHLKIAMNWLHQSLEIREELADEKGIMEVYNGIGDVLRRENKWEEALLYTKKYQSLAQKLNDQKFIQKAYKDLSRAYAGMKNYKLAFEFRKKYDELRYERLDEQRAIQNARREAMYGDIKKQYALERQEKELALQSGELERTKLQRLLLIGGALGLFLLATLLYNRYRIKYKANEELERKNAIIEEERQRSENLLLNILPAATAEELKKNGKTKARYYESTTILFTDFKSFTQLAEQMTPEALVAELDECFRAFDAITEKYNIEKIKTIGDAYMCAGGISPGTTSQATAVVKAALEMQLFLDQYRQRKMGQSFPGFEARIGIHTGPVVAGIVGSKKFAYDIWGDAVNIAARMESSGKVGQVNISRSTYDLVKNDFVCSPRGKIEVKNKEAIEMFFVLEKKAENRSGKRKGEVHSK